MPSLPYTVQAFIPIISLIYYISHFKKCQSPVIVRYLKFAVISTHIHSGNNIDSYDEEMKNLISIVEFLPGFLGAEFAY